MDENVKQIIHDEFEKIKSRLRGNSRLLGYPIDIENIEMFVVAAYMMAKSEVQKEHYDELDRVMRMFGARR